MEFFNQKLDFLEIIFNNLLFSIGILLMLTLFYFWLANIMIIIRFKREWRNNNKIFSAKRCIDEGDRNEGRDHIYLVDKKNKKIHRIVNSYTLNKLGYPRPPRVNDGEEKNKKFYFKIEDGYTLEHKIEIRNINSIINAIKNLRN